MAELGRNNTGMLQKRSTRYNGMTKARRARFLDELAATCNVSASARATGVSLTAVKALRRRDGEFARLWAEAVALGQVQLEEELVARALGQASEDDENPGDERSTPPRRAFDVDLALKIMAIRARTAPGGQRAGRAAPAMTQAEVDEALLARLEAAAARLARARLPAE